MTFFAGWLAVKSHATGHFRLDSAPFPSLLSHDDNNDDDYDGDDKAS